MGAKRAIKRFFLTLMWIGVAAVMFTIIAAAMKSQEASVCKGFDVDISGSQEGRLFTSEKEIIKLLKVATKGEVKGQRKSEFDLPKIEDLLEQSSWVYNAEIYFDNNDILHVKVTERTPLARVFTNTGESFYIDEAGKHIPLSDKITLDVPVFTGYTNKAVMNDADSAFLQNIIATASFINNDSFWTSQVAQIDIKNCGADCWNMDMIPVVGNHKVNLGDGSDIASKFHRLYLFYDQVLKRKGFDKYPRIDVQYAGQVIGMKEKYSKVDSLQLRKNIEDLLQQSRKTNDIIEIMPSVVPGNILLADTAAFANDGNNTVEIDSTALMPAAVEHAVKAAPVAPLTKHETKKTEEVKKAPPAKQPLEEIKPVIKKEEPAKKIIVKPVENKNPHHKNQPQEAKKKPAIKAAANPPAHKKETEKQPVTAKKAEAAKRATLNKPEEKKKEVVKKAAAKPGAKETKKTEPLKKAVAEKPKADSKGTDSKSAVKKPVVTKSITTKKAN